MKTEEIEKLFHELKNSFRGGTINEEEFQGEIRDLFFQDAEGNYWTIGAKTEKWYRYEDDDWVQDSPPPTLEPVGQEIRPPGMEQTPLPPGRDRRYGNRIVLGVGSFFLLLCLITVALVSYQLGRLSVMVSPEATPAASMAMTEVSTIEATSPSEIGTVIPSPTEPGAISTPVATTTQEETSPTLAPTHIPTPTPRATRAPQPTATPMPTPEMKYGPPVLVEPDDGAQFGPGYDAILMWEPIAEGELGENEYYHVEVCWNGCDGRDDFWGDYVQGIMYIFPGFLRGRAIDERYYWDVTVRVQVGDTRGGPSDPPISPSSETWMFLLTEP
jgi:hypothetical protein